MEINNALAEKILKDKIEELTIKAKTLPPFVEEFENIQMELKSYQTQLDKTMGGVNHK